MASNTNGKSKRRGPIRSLIVFIIMAGVVLGAARFIGGGVNPTDPQWFQNAKQTGKKLMDWGDDKGDQIEKNVPSNSPTSKR